MSLVQKQWKDGNGVLQTQNFFQDGSGNLYPMNALSDANGNVIGVPADPLTVSQPDPVQASGSITTADSGSTSTTNLINQTIITGTATSTSVVAFVVTGVSTLYIQATTTAFNGTVVFEKSVDGGTTWRSTSLTTPGATNPSYSSLAFTGITTSAIGRIDCAGATNVRVRCPSGDFTSGTLNIKGQPGYGVLEVSTLGQSGNAGTASSIVSTVQGIASGTPVITTGSGTAGSAASGVVTIQGIASGTPVSVSSVATNPSSNFTRPANTTAYAVGQLVANSVTAGSVVPLSFTAARVSGGSFTLYRVRLTKSGTSTTNAAFRVHLFTATPTIATTGDGGTFVSVVSGAANYLGYYDIVAMQGFADGASGQGAVGYGSLSISLPSSGQTIYGLIEARGAYTPGSAEIFTATLEDIEN